MSSKKKYCSLAHHTETSQTDLVCKSVDWFLYNRQILQGKGLIITSKISTYLQLVHVHLITCQFIVSLALIEAFCVLPIFDRVWNLIPKMGSTENKSVCSVFRAYDFRKA